MKVLLILPPMTLLKNEIPSATFPLGIAYIAAYIENKGFDVTVLDCVVMDQTLKELKKESGNSNMVHFGLSWDKVKKSIEEINPDVVGISCLFSSQSQNAHKIASIVKSIKSIPVVMGGAHPSSVPEEVLNDKNVDVVVLGEGEETFYEYLKNIKKPETLKSLDGFGFKYKGKVIINKKTKFMENLDSLPFPARHLFPMNLYFNAKFGHGVDMMRKPISSVITSRGCPYNCVYCSIHCVWGRGYRIRSAKSVVDEIEHLVKK